MNYINTNIAAMMAHRSLTLHNERMFTTLRNLGTGLRLNSAKDDPSGMVASNQMRSELVGLNAAMNSISRGEQIIATAESGISEINELLLELQSLVTEAGNQSGLGSEERAASQADINAILEAIDRIAAQTEFGGQSLLDGSLDYEVRGNQTDQFEWIHVNAARLGTTGESINVHAEILSEAEKAVAGISLNGQGFFESSLALTVSFEITGPKGSQEFTFTDGTNKLEMEAAISTFADDLGIEVDFSSNSELIIRSQEYGSNQSVGIRVTEANGQSSPAGGFLRVFNNGAWATAGGLETVDFGRDAEMIIDGQVATVDGLEASVVANGFNLDLRIAEDFNVVGDRNFQIISGGAFFDVAAGVNRSELAVLGIRSMASQSIGGIDGVLDDLRSGGSAAIQGGDLLKAQRIVEDALSDVAATQGRLGSFMRYTLESARNTLGSTMEQVAAAEAGIRDVDLAWETAALARNQILSQSAMQALAMANSQPMQILNILGNS